MHTKLLVSKMLIPTIIDHPDHYVLERTDTGTITIKDARALKEWAQLKPFSTDNKRALVIDFHTATIEAQNALLKTFEEPPAYTEFFIHVDDTQNILPTIVSRSEVVYEPENFLPLQQVLHWESRETVHDTSDDIDTFYAMLLNDVKTSSLFDMAETFSKQERPVLLSSLDALLIKLSRDKSLDAPKKVVVGKSLLETKRLIAHNVNTRLALESLALNTR